ncbi:MAG: adenylyl-sulfate kinase [Polyangia bacterium]
MSGVVIWLTGLPRAGKSTLAQTIQARLAEHGERAVLLDSDEVRKTISPPPGYDAESRNDFYATLGRLAALIARQGFVVLVPATAHRRSYRDAARELAPRFLEIHVATPLSDCVHRDPAGLYASSAQSALPGVGVEYEPPRAPDVVASGGHDAAAVDQVVALVEREK